jgi:hypothetical protein
VSNTPRFFYTTPRASKSGLEIFWKNKVTTTTTTVTQDWLFRFGDSSAYRGLTRTGAPTITFSVMESEKARQKMNNFSFGVDYFLLLVAVTLIIGN